MRVMATPFEFLFGVGVQVVGNRIRITQKIADKAAPAAADYFIWDAEVVGFGLCVRKGGAKVYVAQQRVAGASQRQVIGQHGSPWAPAGARAEALRRMGLRDAGSAAPIEAPHDAQDPTVGELCDRYVEMKLATAKPRSIAAAVSAIENHIKPLLGTIKAKRLAMDDILSFRNAVAAGETARTVFDKDLGDQIARLDTHALVSPSIRCLRAWSPRHAAETPATG